MYPSLSTRIKGFLMRFAILLAVIYTLGLLFAVIGGVA